MMIVLSIALISILIYIDQYTKKRARNELLGRRKDYKYIKLSLVKNPGAFRGLLKNHPLVLVSIQILGVIFLLVLLTIQLISKKDKLLILGLSCLVAGASGNLIDRLTNKYVTDFFAVKWTKNLYYNLADMFIFIGAIIVVLRGNKL